MSPADEFMNFIKLHTEWQKWNEMKAVLCLSFYFTLSSYFVSATLYASLVMVNDIIDESTNSWFCIMLVHPCLGCATEMVMATAIWPKHLFIRPGYFRHSFMKLLPIVFWAQQFWVVIYSYLESELVLNPLNPVNPGQYVLSSFIVCLGHPVGVF